MQTQLQNQTKAMLASYIQALAGNQDLDTLLNNYNDNAVFYTPDSVYRGISEIRTFFNSFLKTMPEDMHKAFHIMWQETTAETAHVVWKADPFIPLGTDTFVFRDGKISVQTFSTHIVA